LHRSAAVEDRSAQVLAAAETVASWVRARRVTWNALPPDDLPSDPSSSETLPEDACAERPQSVSEMLTELVLNADFRKELDQ
jgi:hypothetical protein